MASVEGGVLVSSGLKLELLEADGSMRWQVDVPFKVHAAQASQTTVGLLAAHGFFLINTADGTMVNEGEALPEASATFRPDRVAVGPWRVVEVRFISSPNTVEAFGAWTAAPFAASLVGSIESICSGRIQQDTCGAVD